MAKGRGAAVKRADLPRVVKIRVLDPRQKCGPGTSVQHLFRVDESQGGSTQIHLVFFDKYGWYCEHGRTCRAVDDVRKANRQLVGNLSVG